MTTLLTDDFSTSAIGAEWTQDSGTTAAISGGVLKMTTGTSSVLHHTDAAVAAVEDCRVVLKVNRKAGGTTPAPGVILKQLDSDDFLHCRVQASGTIQIYKSVGGSLTQLHTFGITSLAQNTDYWIVGEIQGNTVAAEIWTTDPALGGSPSTRRTQALAGGDITAFGEGVTGTTGIRLSGADAAWEYDDFAVSDFESEGGDTTNPPIGVRRRLFNPGKVAVGW